jgi:hypothetical protein
MEERGNLGTLKVKEKKVLPPTAMQRGLGALSFLPHSLLKRRK